MKWKTEHASTCNVSLSMYMKTVSTVVSRRSQPFPSQTSKVLLQTYNTCNKEGRSYITAAKPCTTADIWPRLLWCGRMLNHQGHMLYSIICSHQSKRRNVALAKNALRKYNAISSLRHFSKSSRSCCSFCSCSHLAGKSLTRLRIKPATMK